MRFNFFNQLTLTIEPNGHSGYEAYFDNEFRRINDRSLDNSDVPTISVNIVAQLPVEQPGDIRRRVRCKRLFTFQYLIRGLNTDSVEIWFKRHFFDKVYINAIAVFLQAQIVEPVIYLKLLENDILFMHAAGVADESGGFLLPASGGTGKTTFSIALVNCGFKLLGDDLLVVDVNKQMVYPYPRPLHLFGYNINNLFGTTVPFKYRLAIYTKNFIRFLLERLLQTEFLISTRVHADELFDESPFGKPVPYKKLYFLRKTGPAVDAVKIGRSTLNDIAEQLLASADLNDSLYALLGNERDVDRVIGLEKQVVSRLLRQFETISYVNTRELDLLNLHKFVQENF